MSLEIVALGARTPVGQCAEASAAAVRARIPRGSAFPFADPRGEPVVVTSDAMLDPMMEGRERMLPMLQSVLSEVGDKLARAARQATRRCLWLALPEARPGFSEQDAAWLVDALRRDPTVAELGLAVEVVGRGHAGSVRAVEHVFQDCARNPDTLYLVAGVDSYLHPKTFLWLEEHRRFAQPGVRSGFTPGEGAGCLALVTPGLRKHLGATCLAVVAGAGSGQEALLRESETGSFGQGMTQAVQGAMKQQALPRDAVDVVYSDINGERYRSEEWGFVALRLGTAFKSLAYEAPCDCWGDVGAAFPVLAGVLAARSFARGYARGPRALAIAGSDGGLRGALLLHDPRLG